MTLLDGDLLWHLIWILPLIVLIFYWGSRKRKVLLKKFLGEQADDPARVNASPVLRFWRAVLFAGTVILLLAAAARPSWGMRILPYSGQGRDLMVVFDVSKSMLSQDVRPSRLDHAKWLVRQLCTRNPGDRFGLIAFAGNAFLECPLTIDQTSFLQSVDELSVDTIPVGGTNIQQALTEAIRGFRAAETTHRAVILITDGDELTGKSTEALDRIIQLKIPLFILGIGDPSQPAIVQLRDEKGNVQTLKDAGGNVVSVPLNEKMLAGLASKTGGIYVRSTTTHPGLDLIEARIKQLEKHDIDSGKQTRPIERPLYPLLGAFILFCLWLLLGERRNFAARTAVRLLLICGLAGLSFSMSAQTVQTQPEEKAAPAAEKQKENQPANLSPEELFNLGLKAQTQEKDPAKAVQLYEQVIAAVNASPEVRAKAAQNLGVLNHQQARAMLQKTGQSLQAQQLDPALQQTDQALKQFALTEEIYKNALREGTEVAPVSRNQYQLIQDRKYAEELKKKIEELKKKQQEARKNTQQAMQQQKQQQNQQNQQKQQKQQKQQPQNQQNQQNQQKQQPQNQQKQQQNQQNRQNQQKQQPQNQQKQQQNQQNQPKQQPQNQQNQTEKARDSVRQLEQQAKELNQKKMEEQAKKAGEELDKARQAQKLNNNKDAEKHLEKALEHLGKEQPRQNQKKQDQKQGQDKDRKQDQKQQDKDRKGQPKPDKQLPKPGPGKVQNAKPEPEKEIGKEQAEALLEVMAGDEKKLKDELKARMKRNYGTRPVEKDW